MKKIVLAPAFFAAVIGLSSCIKEGGYYNVQPVTPGYASTFNDDFNSDLHNWSFNDNVNNAHVSVYGGMLQYSYFPPASGTNTVAVTTGASLAYNFDLQTRIKTDNSMALVFGVSNTDYGYSFFINNQGQFALYDEGDATHPYQTLLNWQTSNAINTNGWNSLEMEQRNGYWNGYINGNKVFSIAAHTLYGDQIGFMELANTNGTADYLTVQW